MGVGAREVDQAKVDSSGEIWKKAKRRTEKGPGAPTAVAQSQKRETVLPSQARCRKIDRKTPMNAVGMGI